MDKFAAMRDRYVKFRNDCLEHAHPLIIIWGPGPSAEQLYKKRSCVRDAINKLLPNGNVVFPEDPEVIEIIRDVFGDQDLDVIEQIEAVNADIVIALDLSPAVGEEVARYSINSRIANRLFVVTSSAGKTGYQKAIRNKALVRDLNGDDMTSCEKPIELCVNHVASWCVWNDLNSNGGRS